MLFEDDFTMPPAKEIPITFRCSERLRDWIYAQAGDMDLSVSELTRAALICAVPQIKAIRGLSRVDLEDIRDAEKKP